MVDELGFAKYSRLYPGNQAEGNTLKQILESLVALRPTLARDRTVIIDGRLFEAPVALIGKRIDLLYHKNATHRVEARWNNESYGLLRPVDLAVNCRVKRDRNRNTQIETISRTPPKGGKIW